MKKLYVIISIIIYIALTSITSYSVMPEITRELFNNNSIILFVIGLIFNVIILLADIFVMNFVEKIVYKIVTKKTLQSKESRTLTVELLTPILITHAVLVLLTNVINIKSILLALFFLNPLIYYLQFKALEEIKNIAGKLILIIPFICFIILDLVSIFSVL